MLEWQSAWLPLLKCHVGRAVSQHPGIRVRSAAVMLDVTSSVSRAGYQQTHAIVAMQGTSAWIAVGLFMGVLSFSGCHVSGAACQHLDINARYAAAMYGLTNGLSTVLEAGGIAGTGYILETQHSWAALFVVVAGLHVLGGLVYVCFSDSKPRFQDTSRTGYKRMKA